ncbi:hypothetical protein FK220_004290 [Flavobacteriaceae bacterium TP-CH-4]|uniref:CHRD domain-containing protein n=1 Tax=Pelagihabitans pacificus TaxID=2696054 RepID=A0A967AT84_9FLAO|nr:hypothetical protein [Pelagihabitans pacificus]
MEKLATMTFGVMILFFVSCSDDDDQGAPIDPVIGDTKVYELRSVTDPDISGTATFADNGDNSVTVTIALVNTPDGGQHPAHIHFNTAAEGGGIAVTLGTVDGTTGESEITFSELDDGTPISYSDLLTFDGYINVHLSADDLDTLVAQGDIGENELGNESVTYDLGSVAVEDIQGTVTFTERTNGQALAEISLENTPEGGIHPAHIHFNTAAEGGAIAFTFNPVDGTTGKSFTNVEVLDDGLTAFLYDDVVGYDGYVNVHLSADDLGTLVAQGDIGQNDLMEDTKTYTLATVDVDGIEGTATFTKRINGEALAVLELVNTPEGGEHPAHIHMNSAAEGGPIVFTFTPVDGDSGTSKTNVSALDDETNFRYDDVLQYDGYINVHLSADDLATLVAQGNIGSNE